MLIYLHDTPAEEVSGVGANRTNTDAVPKVAAFLEANGAVTLTADDGYKSILNLVPLLEAYDARLILFVTTGLVDRTVYPYEVQICDFLLQTDRVFSQGIEIDVSDLSQKEEFFRSVHKSIKHRGLQERERFLEAFFEENSVDGADFRKDVFLSIEELASLSQHPNVEIGSHCLSHLVLPKLRWRDIFAELRRSKRILEELTGQMVTKVSYPYGANDRKTRILARLAGYQSGYGTETACGGQMAQRRVSLASE